jgi:hypothetical protein
VLLFVGCSDSLIRPQSVQETQVPARGIPAVEAMLPAEGSPFVCYTSHLTPQGPHRYRYGKLRLDFPRQIIENANGEVLYFRYVQRTPEGTVVRLANCVIPKSPVALRLAKRRFSNPTARPATNEATELTSTNENDGCVRDNSESNPCVVEEIRNICADDPNDPECDEDEKDPWGDEPGDNDPCSSNPNAPGCGGDDPCWDCGSGGRGDDNEEATASVSCTPTVERGMQVSCTVSVTPSTAGLEVYSWTFSGGGFVVEAPGGQTRWEGSAVAGGRVTALVRVNGRTQSPAPAASFTVAERGWRWGKARWHLTEDAGPDHRTAEPTWTGGTLGWNCSTYSCGITSWVLPHIPHQPNGGYTVGQVNSGPNQGLWFVGAAVFRIDRYSKMNPHMRANAPKRRVWGESAQACRDAGYTNEPSVEVNLYTFNRHCKGVNMTAFHRAILNHEGYGSGSRNGHQAQGEDAAAKIENDMHAQLEDIVFQTEADLRAEVGRRYRDVDDRIWNAARSHQFVRGNWTLGYWVWDPDSTTYRFDWQTNI